MRGRHGARRGAATTADDDAMSDKLKNRHRPIHVAVKREMRNEAPKRMSEKQKTSEGPEGPEGEDEDGEGEDGPPVPAVPPPPRPRGSQRRWCLEVVQMLFDEVHRSSKMIVIFQRMLKQRSMDIVASTTSWESLYKQLPDKRELAFLQEVEHLDFLGSKIHNLIRNHATPNQLKFLSKDVAVLMDVLRDVDLYVAGWRLTRQNTYLRWNVEKTVWTEYEDWNTWRHRVVPFLAKERTWPFVRSSSPVMASLGVPEHVASIRDKLILGNREYQKLVRRGDVDAVRAKADELVDLSVKLARAQAAMEQLIWSGAEERRREHLADDAPARATPFDDVLHREAGYLDLRAVEDSCMWPLHVTWLEPFQMGASARRRKLREWRDKFSACRMDAVPGRRARKVGWDRLKVSAHTVMWKLCLLELRVVTNLDRQEVEEHVLLRDLLMGLERKLVDLLARRRILEALRRARGEALPEVPPPRPPPPRLPAPTRPPPRPPLPKWYFPTADERVGRRSRSVPSHPPVDAIRVRSNLRRAPRGLQRVYPRIQAVLPDLDEPTDEEADAPPDALDRLVDPNNNKLSRSERAERAAKKKKNKRLRRQVEKAVERLEMEKVDLEEQGKELNRQGADLEMRTLALKESIVRRALAMEMVRREKEMRADEMLSRSRCDLGRLAAHLQVGVGAVSASRAAWPGPLPGPWPGAVPVWLDARVRYRKQPYVDLTTHEFTLMERLGRIQGTWVREVVIDNGGPALTTNDSGEPEFSVIMAIEGFTANKLNLARSSPAPDGRALWSCRHTTVFTLNLFLYETELVPCRAYRDCVRSFIEDMVYDKQNDVPSPDSPPRTTRGPKRRKWTEPDLCRRVATLEGEAMFFPKVLFLFNHWRVSMESELPRRRGKGAATAFHTHDMRIVLSRCEPFRTRHSVARGVDAIVQCEYKMASDDMAELTRAGRDLEMVRSGCLFDFMTRMVAIVEETLAREIFIEHAFYDVDWYEDDTPPAILGGPEVADEEGVEQEEEEEEEEEKEEDEEEEHERISARGESTKAEVSTARSDARKKQRPPEEKTPSRNADPKPGEEERPKGGADRSEPVAKAVIASEKTSKTNVKVALKSEEREGAGTTPPSPVKSSRPERTEEMRRKMRESFDRFENILSERKRATEAKEEEEIDDDNDEDDRKKEGCDGIESQSLATKPHANHVDKAKSVSSAIRSADSKTSPPAVAKKPTKTDTKEEEDQWQRKTLSSNINYNPNPNYCDSVKLSRRDKKKNNINNSNNNNYLKGAKREKKEKGKQKNINNNSSNNNKKQKADTQQPTKNTATKKRSRSYRRSAPTVREVLKTIPARGSVRSSPAEAADGEAVAFRKEVALGAKELDVLVADGHALAKMPVECFDVVLEPIREDDEPPDERLPRAFFLRTSLNAPDDYEEEEEEDDVNLPSKAVAFGSGGEGYEEEVDGLALPKDPNIHVLGPMHADQDPYVEEEEEEEEDIYSPGPYQVLSDAPVPPFIFYGNQRSDKMVAPAYFSFPSPPAAYLSSIDDEYRVQDLPSWTAFPPRGVEERFRELVAGQRAVLGRLIDDLTLEAGHLSQSDRLALQDVQREAAWRRMQDLYREHRAEQLALMDSIVLDHDGYLDRGALIQSLKSVLEDMQMTYRQYTVLSPVYPDDYPVFKGDVPRLHETKILQGRKVTTV